MKTTIVLPERWPSIEQTRDDIERDIIGFIHDQAEKQGFYIETCHKFAWVSSPQTIPDKIHLVSIDHQTWANHPTPIKNAKWRGLKSRTATITWEPIL